ncbi:MAG: hypothetical protein KJS83_13055, partial [Xanthomonadaceae bacterium]|nr:hypothetical protein [Xanthomonadaceae bacterium]
GLLAIRESRAISGLRLPDRKREHKSGRHGRREQPGALSTRELREKHRIPACAGMTNHGVDR